MQSSLYITVKNIISLLEATDYLSLEMCQCRLLIVFYEIGHGLFPAASISIAACAQAARTLGLHNQWSTPVTTQHTLDEEERRRVWWAVFNLDRFINLCNNDALFATEDPRTDVLLPFDDGTSSDITMGQFARECQISYLVGRVLRHVLDPTSDRNFHASEELQLERTLKAFMPLLMEEDSKYGQYCAALAICTSALFNLYDAAMKQYNDEDLGKLRILDCIESAAIRLVDFSRHLFADPESIDIRNMSPLIPLSLYQAAMIQYRAWKRTNEIFCKERVTSLFKILANFSKRWFAAAKYLQTLHSLKME
ncbi:uncharacterized protein PV07_02390 [Cladophialophora immunda]|uniref:Xylanolytic transcriptional activator regulatory domain-containing protein n=1 Tax=Cladophialophora immunda TaxID=569365 RepID=A0A0D2A5R3_9EURO|nr:uncharacterized protein PV07_02390 [Cladophialophora immunda]KIW35706.1 hypothetical protein PV07_02390 [Cladophialophora immunda]